MSLTINRFVFVSLNTVFSIPVDSRQKKEEGVVAGDAVVEIGEDVVVVEVAGDVASANHSESTF